MFSSDVRPARPILRVRSRFLDTRSVRAIGATHAVLPSAQSAPRTQSAPVPQGSVPPDAEFAER